MGGLVAGQGTAARNGASRRLGTGRFPALAAAGLTLALIAANVPLAAFAHTSVNSGGGSVPVWFAAPFGVLGFVVAWRKPRNALAWALLAGTFFSVLAQDASFYTIADYRLRHGTWPLGGVALFAQPGWAPSIVLLGLAVLLFPDGRAPSSRWRWVVWGYLGASLLWVVSAEVLTGTALAGHHVGVDPSGNLLLLAGNANSPPWWNTLSAVFFVSLALCWLGSTTSQVASYRRSSGERRQQLKWLAAGATALAAGVVAGVVLGSGLGYSATAGSTAVAAGGLAFPVCMGVAIVRYRLFDIDRVVSRTIAYAVVTGLLLGVYAGVVLLATKVAGINQPIAVAGSTLAAVALFNPLRRRVQRAVDRRFNRARYDAERTVAAFAGRLADAVDLESARGELIDVVARSLEPAHISLWVAQR